MDAKKELIKIIKDSNFEDHYYLELLTNVVRNKARMEKPTSIEAKSKVEEEIKNFLSRQRFVNQVDGMAPAGRFVTLAELLAESGINTTVQKFGQVMASVGVFKHNKKIATDNEIKVLKNIKGYYLAIK